MNRPPGKHDSAAADCTLLVAAAGAGRRLGMGPKAFLQLGDKTLLRWTVEMGHICARETRVAVPADGVALAREILSDLPQIQIMAGGHTRQETFNILLEHCTTPLVAIRDVARPLASPELLLRVIEAARRTGAAGAFLPLDTPVALVQDGLVSAALPTDAVMAPSNPQAYDTKLLRRALAVAAADAVQVQTLWELVLREGTALYPVAGEPENMKVTHPIDWQVVNEVILPVWLQKYAEQEISKNA